MNKLIAVLDQPKFDLTELPLQVVDKESIQILRLDNRAKNSLNSVLDTDFIAVYRSTEDYQIQWNAQDLNWGDENVLLITSKGGLVRMSNSEWASFERVITK